MSRYIVVEVEDKKYFDFKVPIPLINKKKFHASSVHRP